MTICTDQQWLHVELFQPGVAADRRPVFWLQESKYPGTYEAYYRMYLDLWANKAIEPNEFELALFREPQGP